MLILTGFAVVAMATATTVFCSQSSNVSSVLMQNVEALAEGETPTVDCQGADQECLKVTSGDTTFVFYKN